METPETPESPKDPLSISFAIADQQKDIVDLLVIGVRTNGSVFHFDTDLTVDQAKKLLYGFISWMDASLGRQLERESRDPEA